MSPHDMVRSGELVWFREEGVGYVHPVEPIPYGKEYFDEYVERSRLRASDVLMSIRLSLIDNHYSGEIVDVGAGALTFVEYMRQCGRTDIKGYDVNPYSVQTLVNSGLYRNPFIGPKPEALTMWDVLEHMNDPEAIIRRAERWVFLSLPIFKNADRARSSRHYKPNEHIWYFTERGLIELFRKCGFTCEEISDKESESVRVGIKSYAFRRVEA